MSPILLNRKYNTKNETFCQNKLKNLDAFKTSKCPNPKIQKRPSKTDHSRTT